MGPQPGYQFSTHKLVLFYLHSLIEEWAFKTLGSQWNQYTLNKNNSVLMFHKREKEFLKITYFKSEAIPNLVN